MLKNIIILISLFLSFLNAKEDLDALLEDYRGASELSNITKNDLAGFLQVYTRDDLERMQVHTLMDVMKTLPGYAVNTVSDNEYILSKAGSVRLAPGSISLYINNHKISLFSQFSTMSIEHIDHIEIYNMASSVEMGGETAPMVIKLYTKSALHDEGSRLNVSTSNLGDINTNVYTTSTLENDISYFGFVDFTKNKKDDLSQEYNNEHYTGEFEKDNYLAYFSVTTDTATLEVSHFVKKSTVGLGVGDYKTPADGGYNNSGITYAHILKKFPANFTFDIGITHSSRNRKYRDLNGITVGYVGTTPVKVEELMLERSSNNLEVLLNKKVNYGENKFLFGVRFELDDASSTTSTDNGTVTNVLEQPRREYKTSLMVEDKYTPINSFKIISSATVDLYRYKDSDEYENEYMFRFGGVKSIDNYQLRFFSSYSYHQEKQANFSFLAAASTAIEVQDSSEYKYGIGIKKTFSNSEIEFIYTYNKLNGEFKSSKVLRSTSLFQISDTSDTEGIELHYKYIYDKENRLYLTYYYGNTEADLESSPADGLNIMLFNQYKQIEFYNELICKGTYVKHDSTMPRTYMYSSSIHYYYTPDLSFKLKGENIFNKGPVTSYSNYEKSVDIYERKITLGLEYLF